MADSYFFDSCCEWSEFVPKTPLTPPPPADSHPLPQTPPPPTYSLVVLETPEELWSTPEYRRRMRWGVEKKLDWGIQFDNSKKSTQSVVPSATIDDGGDGEWLPPNYVRGPCHEMMKLLVPDYFRKPKGATLVDRIVTISLAENYIVKPETKVRLVENAVNTAHVEDTSVNTEAKSGKAYVDKAQEVVSNMIAKGSAIRLDAVNKAKAFDEKHQLTASASAKVNSFDKRVGLTEKLTVGISVVNEKVKSVDQRFHVSDKTMAALFAAERKLNDTGSAVKSSRYVTVGTAWLNGAFSRVSKVGLVAGTKTRQKFNTAMSNLTAKDPIAA